MSFPQNEEENGTTSTEETGRPLPESSEQPQINILNVHHYHHHHHIDQQLLQVHNQQNITKIVHQPEQTNVRFGDQEDPSKAFNKLKKTTGELYDRKFDVDVARFDIPASNLPEVHPELMSIDFYVGRFIPNDDQYDPKTKQIQFKESDKNVSIDELISRIESQSFISIVGYPGAGKTTLSKRLARSLDQTRDFLVLRIPFMNISDCDDEKLTLKGFLLGDVKYNLEKKEKNVIFSWMKNHTQKCFLIFDGFDQVNWNLIDKVKRSNYDTLLTYQELVSNLCQGLLLPNCHIVFTSRPHAMLKIPQMCRPKQTYFIGELTSENMKKLFDALINSEQKSSKFFDKLTVETPHLESMCHNPLMLQLYLRASLGSSDETVNISTMTAIFHRVLENLKSSDHAVSLSDQIVISLSKLAFQATKNKTVLITMEDLQTEHLTSEQVQALVVTLFGSNRRCGLLEGNRRLYFSHQTFQEFFSALYMVDQMSLKNFTRFVRTSLMVDHWSVVVQFLSGLLLDPWMNEASSSPAFNQQQSSIEFTLPQTSSQKTPSLQPLSNLLQDSILQESHASNQAQSSFQDVSNQAQSSSQEATNQQQSSSQDASNQPQSSSQDASNQPQSSSQDASNQPQSFSQDALNVSQKSKPQSFIRKLKYFTKNIFPKSSGRTTKPLQRLQPFPHHRPSFLRSTTIQSPSEESDISLLQPPSQQTRLSSPGQKWQKREIFISELYEKTREVAANYNDVRSIIAISRILREGNDEEVTVAAGSHFHGGKIQISASDSRNDIHAVTSFLKSMPGRIRCLILSRCKMNSNQFRPLKKAIKSMPGSIVRMDLYDNLLTVDDVIGVMSKVEEGVGMLRCLDDGDWKGRVANMMERSMLKEALDGLDNKKLKILVDIFDDVVITHKDRDN